MKARHLLVLLIFSCFFYGCCTSGQPVKVAAKKFLTEQELNKKRDPRPFEEVIKVFTDKSQSQEDRFFAGWSVYFLKDYRSLEPAMAILQDPDENGKLKGIACNILGKLKNPKAIPVLVDYLCQDKYADGAWELCQIGRQAIQPLEEKLKSKKPLARSNAACALGRFLKAGIYDRIHVLLGLMKDPVDDVRHSALAAISHSQDPRVEYFAPYQDDPYYLVRGLAILRLADLEDGRYEKYLDKALTDEHKSVRRCGLHVIMQICSTEYRAMIKLEKFIKNENDPKLKQRARKMYDSLTKAINS